MLKKTVSIIALTLILGACANDFQLNKQTVGTGMGAVAGGLLGSQVGSGDGQLVAVGVGTLLGAWLGSEVGASLDKADQAYAAQALDKANNAPINEVITWQNPKSGNSGTYTATREGTTPSGKYCREFQQTITVGGKTERAYGQAVANPTALGK